MEPPGRNTRDDLGECNGLIEPVKRLRDRDDVGRAVRQRHSLARAGERSHPWHRPLELRPHLGQRLDGGDAVPRGDELPSNFPVPAPRSTTSAAVLPPASQVTAPRGYSGRARSYSSATEPNEAARISCVSGSKERA